MNRLFLLLFLFVSPLFAKETFKIAQDPTWGSDTLGNETYSITAFTGGLLRELSDAENIALDLFATDSSELLKGLCEENYDGIFTTLQPDATTKEKYDFSSPLLRYGPVLVVREESRIKSLKDLKGKNLGISAFDRSVLVAQKVPAIYIQLYQSMPEALTDLSQGKIDGVLMSTIQAHALVGHRYPGVLRIATAPLNDDAVRLVTLKGKKKALLSYFNRGIKKLKKSGLYTLLRLQYGVN